jgi:hypothetical protein
MSDLHDYELYKKSDSCECSEIGITYSSALFSFEGAGKSARKLESVWRPWNLGPRRWTMTTERSGAISRWTENDNFELLSAGR